MWHQTHNQVKNLQQEKKIFNLRIYFAMALVGICLAVLIIRYGYLQLYQHQHFQTISESNRIRLQSIPPARGNIYDRNGILLAHNYPIFSITVNKAQYPKINNLINNLQPILNLSAEDIGQVQKRFKDARKTDQVTIKFHLTDEDIARFSEVKYQFPDVEIATQMTRIYPYDDLFAHLIGYVGRINDKELKVIDKDKYAGTNLIGKIGIEKFYEQLLHGQKGHESVEVNVHGTVLKHLEHQPAIRGNDLYLSLDFHLQKFASEQLAQKRGAIIALDPRNGEVLAMVSSPSFNPNLFVTGISHKDYNNLNENLDQPLYNRALQGTYPPASTIKPMAGLGGIHYGYIDWNTKIFDPGYFQIPGDSHKFRDWKKSGHGIVDLHKAITQSSDTYFYILSYQMGIDNMYKWMTQFGFGEKTGIDLPYEGSGLYPSPEWKMRTRGTKWLMGETISVSIGQGAFTATPLQLALSTAIVANSGKHITPHLLKESKGSTPYPIHHDTDGKILFNGTPNDWVKMHHAMIDVIQSGTGQGIKSGLQYQIAGKTGTAQVKSIAQGKHYNEALLSERHYDHALFIGFAPADNPQIVLAIILENGRSGSAAAKVARPIFDYWLKESIH